MTCVLTLSLGGYLDTVEQAAALAKAIASEYLYNDEREHIGTVEQAQTAMRRAIEANTSLDLTDSTHDHGGNLYDIDPLIESYPSLQKMAHFENEGGANTIERTWTANGKLTSTSVDHYDYSGALITSREIKEALATDTPIESVQALLDQAEVQAGSDFPPLTASPAVQVWLKIFGSAAA